MLFLASCANSPQPTISLDASSHQISLRKQQNWLVKGRLGFKSPEKKQSAYFRWKQMQQEYQLNLTSIIGTSLLTMQGDDRGATLITDDETYQDNDPSHLIWRITGWQIPVEKLQYWIKGQQQVGDHVQQSKQGWISQLQPSCLNCENWQIDYDNYQLIDDIWLPHKIVMRNNLNNSQLIIKINEWTLYE